MSLDSLTDLVSNAVGVLILLLLMTALQSKKPHFEPPLPIEHQSGLIPQFYYIHTDRIQHIDVNAVFTNGLLAASEAGSDAEYRINADFMGRPDEVLTLAITPVDTEHWPTYQDLGKADSPIASAVSMIDKKEHFAFVFVHDDGEGAGFSEFLRVRQWFLDRGIAVGWLPVTEENPAYLCSWSDVSACRYSPSYYGYSG